MKRSVNKGFTIVEIVIVMLIISILTVVAIPAYQGYSVRARVTELVLATSACKSMVQEVVQFSKGGSLPGQDQWGCENISGGPVTTKYVSSVTVDQNGVITVEGNATELGLDVASQNRLRMVPYLESNIPLSYTDVGEVVAIWRCGPAPAPNGIASRYLPSSCRES